MSEPGIVKAVRLDNVTIQRITAHVIRLQALWGPAVHVTEGMALRDLLLKALDMVEAPRERAHIPQTQEALMPTTAPIAPEIAIPQEVPLGQEPSLTAKALVAAIVPGVEYDTTRHYLGQLCSRGHNYQGTGQSLRRRSSKQCVECDKALAAARREVKRRE
jgi:hypothetical protein